VLCVTFYETTQIEVNLFLQATPNLTLFTCLLALIIINFTS
jgi:hypothetical protein